MARDIPCAQETEANVLGYVLSSGEVQWNLLTKMADGEPTSLFFSPEYHMVALSIERAYESGNGWSLSGIEDHLLLLNRGESIIDPKQYLIELQLKSSVTSERDFISGTKVLTEKRVLRRQLAGVESVIAKILDSDSGASPSEINDDLGKVAISSAASREIRSMREVIEELEETESAPWVVTTGLDDLDDVIGGGYQPGRVYVVSAETKIGKTTFVMNNALSALHDDVAVIFFSAETLEREFYGKMLAAESFVNQKDVVDLIYRRKSIEDFDPEDREYLTEGRKFLMDSKLSPLFSKDISSGVSSSLISAVMHVRSVHGAGVPIIVYIDYLQLLVNDQINATPEINQLTRDFKIMATDLEVPIVFLSQLNKEGMTGEMPTVRNLKGSSSIGQDCDAAIMLHRPHHYDPAEPEHIMEIGIPINRMGSPSFVQVRWDGAKNTITNLDDD